jgi:hypothetical protein
VLGLHPELKSTSRFPLPHFLSDQLWYWPFSN